MAEASPHSELAREIAREIAALRDDQRREYLDYDPAVHADHHQFIETLIQKQERRQRLWVHVRNTVIGAAVLGFLGLIAKLGAVGFEIFMQGLEAISAPRD